MGRKFKLSSGEVADIEDDELDEFMSDMKASGRTVRLVKDDPAPDVVVDIEKPIAAVADKPAVTTTVVETKGPKPFELDKPSPPPTLSTETDRKEADTAPSNPENQQKP